MKFEHEVATLPEVDAITIRMQEHRLLRWTQLEVRAVAARDEQGAGALRIASAHEHVEINKAAELEVAIDLKSQGRSLVWDGGDPVTFEILEHAAQFSDKHEIACSVLLEVVAYLL